MFMINYTTPENAEGAVKKVYSMFPEGITVPDPIQLYSASPRYLLKQMAIIGDFMNDDAYDHGFLAAMRYIGASNACFGACTTFNKDLLLAMGLTAEDIATLGSDPANSFEEKEAAMLTLVSKSTAAPDSVTQADIDQVRAQSWTDQQIFEITAYAAQMATIGIIFRTFAKK
ncbi:MAG: hypothetical protein OCC46_05455 [Pseudodesulfovibrio sp.]